MNYSPHYSTLPPGYMPYDCMRTPPVSPAPGAHGYYSPRYSAHTATPSPRASPKVHARRASQADPHYSHRVPPHYYSYASPRHYASPHPPPQRAPDYVSGFDSARRRGSRGNATVDAPTRRRSDRKRRSSHSRHLRHVIDDDHVRGDKYDYVPGYHSYSRPPPPYEPFARDPACGNADACCCCQIPIYTEAEPKSRDSRPRRASHSSSRPHQPTQKRSSAPKSTMPKATEDDARRVGIPAGYSYKNWDPTEEPIMLLGSVFDANSLGKWIFDWTVFHYGPATPIADLAGDLWLLLIQLAGKVKRAEECMPKIRRQENREMVEDFLESGERLWIRFAKLLKICEDYMWKAAKKDSGEKKPVNMGKNSGCEFVDTVFGRDRELEKTEKLMTGMRLWGMRFDANCEDILRHPTV